MSGYVYAEHRAHVFTERGQEQLLTVLKCARECIEKSGAVLAVKLLNAAGSGDSWDMMAVVERLVELNYLRAVYDCGAWQDIVYVKGGKSW